MNANRRLSSVPTTQMVRNPQWPAGALGSTMVRNIVLLLDNIGLHQFIDGALGPGALVITQQSVI